jgi:hypothetical protein
MLEADMKFSSTNGQTFGEVLAVRPPMGATTSSMVWGRQGEVA